MKYDKVSVGIFTNMNLKLLKGSVVIAALLAILACSSIQPRKDSAIQSSSTLPSPELLVLGIAQDAGYPQANCKKDCCSAVWADKSARRMVSCLGLRDPITRKAWLFDATPDFKDQLRLLLESQTIDYNLGGIFLTHGHMGHYTGMMELGREAMGASEVPVHVMPRMKEYLTTNGPWSQLVRLGNIDLRPMSNGTAVQLSENISVIPFTVPHRDEFTETVGYEIRTENSSVLYIPDIDKWEKWSVNIVEEIQRCDHAFLDGTFYRNGEIWGRDMSQIPHPFIEESMEVMEDLSEADKRKVHFIHLNHTNPLLDSQSEETQQFLKKGFGIAEEEVSIFLDKSR